MREHLASGRSESQAKAEASKARREVERLQARVKELEAALANPKPHAKLDARRAELDAWERDLERREAVLEGQPEAGDTARDAPATSTYRPVAVPDGCEVTDGSDDQYTQVACGRPGQFGLHVHVSPDAEEWREKFHTSMLNLLIVDGLRSVTTKERRCELQGVETTCRYSWGELGVDGHVLISAYVDGWMAMCHYFQDEGADPSSSICAQVFTRGVDYSPGG